MSLIFAIRHFAGPFEKCLQWTTIIPLSGQLFSEKVSEYCIALWMKFGSYTKAEAEAIEKFLEVFQDQTFQPGASIVFTQSPKGSLTVSRRNFFSFLFIYFYSDAQRPKTCVVYVSDSLCLTYMVFFQNRLASVKTVQHLNVGMR